MNQREKSRSRLMTVLLVLAVFSFGVQGYCWISLMDIDVRAQRAEVQRSAVDSTKGLVAFNGQQLLTYVLTGNPENVTNLQRGRWGITTLLTPEVLSYGAATGHLRRVSTAEERWYSDFAQKLIERRQMLDSGKGTLQGLQVLFLELDPESEARQLTMALANAELAMGAEISSLHEQRLNLRFAMLAAIGLGGLVVLTALAMEISRSRNARLSRTF